MRFGRPVLCLAGAFRSCSGHGMLVRMLAVLVLSASGACFAETGLPSLPPPSASEKLFLERLMAVESGGRLNAKNPATSALGPFQFLRVTFLDVIRRNFPSLAEGKSDAEILTLRTNAVVSWNAALIYTRENARFLSEHGAAISPANLRMAFLVGPSAALKVLAAKPEEQLTNILSAAAVEANPFLGRMTAAALIERSAREMRSTGKPVEAAAPQAKAPQQKAKPKIAVLCNLRLPSCRKWLALAETRMQKGPATQKTARR
jgi:hypothetical protein